MAAFFWAWSSGNGAYTLRERGTQYAQMALAFEEAAIGVHRHGTGFGRNFFAGGDDVAVAGDDRQLSGLAVDGHGQAFVGDRLDDHARNGSCGLFSDHFSFTFAA